MRIEENQIKKETKEYVPKFIAASLIAANPGDFGFEDIEYNQPMSYDEVELDSPVDLSVAAECAGTDIEVIRKLNPELRRWCTPPDASPYTLRVPEGTKETFLEKLAAVPEEERLTMERYTVRRGDSFWRISKRTGVPQSVILSLNSMEKIMPLKAGSTLYVPPKGLLALDAEDRAAAKKVSLRGKKRSHLPRKKIKKSKKA